MLLYLYLFYSINYTIKCRKIIFIKLIYEDIFLPAWCPIPTLVHGSVVHFSHNCPNGTCSTNTRATFKCESNNYLYGYGIITCLGYGEWDLPLPVCEGKSGCISLAVNLVSVKGNIKEILVCSLHVIISSIFIKSGEKMEKVAMKIRYSIFISLKSRNTSA